MQTQVIQKHLQVFAHSVWVSGTFRPRHPTHLNIDETRAPLSSSRRAHHDCVPQSQSSLALDPSDYRPIPIIKLNLKGVKDFGEVTPNLYRGVSDKKYAKFLEVVDTNPDKRIFVECTLGDDCTGMAIVAFRIANQGYTPEEAMEEMRAYGFNKFHHVMCWYLASYENHFPQTYATHPAFNEDRKLYPPPQPFATSQ